jgi:hypothetical protein
LFEPLPSSATVDPQAAIQQMQDKVQPVMTWATNWATKAGLGITGLSFFYRFVIVLADPGNK